MSVKELIKILENMPQDYEVVFESGDAYGSAYTAYVDEVNVNKKMEYIELSEL
jgi:hypothetical protein